jgi:hypothetical protein
MLHLYGTVYATCGKDASLEGAFNNALGQENGTTILEQVLEQVLDHSPYSQQLLHVLR